MNIQNRPPIFVPREFRSELEKLSKAALMDLVWDLAAVCATTTDDPIGVMEKVREHATVVTMHRAQVASGTPPTRSRKTGRAIEPVTE